MKKKSKMLLFKGVDKAGLLYGFGRESDAMVCLEKILRRNPRDVGALLLKARILLDVGQSKAALDIVNVVLAHYPNKYEALLTKALVCYDRGRNRDALRIFAQLGKTPRIRLEERRYLYSFWVNALVGDKRWRTAKRVLDEAVDRFPDDDILNHFKTVLGKKLSKQRPP